MKVNFSFDDNHIKNIELSKLFSQYKFTATFFINIIPQRNHVGMSVKEIKELHSKGFEIGAHTISHKPLSSLSLLEAKNEISQSKIHLESMLKSKIYGFCYPKGQYSPEIIDAVKEAGFKYARATGEGNMFTIDPFCIVPTVQIYNTSYRRLLRNQLKYNKNRSFAFSGDWKKTAINFIKKYEFNPNDPVIRIFGHSWEIEKQKQWDSLISLLDFIEKNNYKVISESSESTTTLS